MSNKLSVAPPIKIDISIRRCKKEFNQKQHLLNYAGSHFEKPKICQGHNNNRYQCQALELEDVLSLRNILYKSTERNILSNQLRKWITLIPPKKHTTNENSKTAKLMTMFYKIPTKQDKELPICREMFLASTGLTKSRFQTMMKKICRKDLLEQKFELTINTTEAERETGKAKKLEELLRAKTEKILMMQSGSLSKIQGLIKGPSSTTNHERFAEQVVEENEDYNQMDCENDDFSGRIVEECLSTESSSYEDIEIIENEEFIVLNQLDLVSMEVCRICLHNSEILFPIFEKLDDEAESYQDLLDYGFNLKLIQDESFPDKICETCLEKLKMACEFKSDMLNSEEVMSVCIEETQVPREPEEIPDGVVEQIYHDQSNVEEEVEIQTESHLMEIDLLEDQPNISRKGLGKIYHLKADPQSAKAEKCYLCDLEFENETDVEHFEKYHRKIELTKCEKCMFQTEFPFYLNLHYQIHKDDYRLCGTCGIKCDSREKYHSHIRGCHRKNTPKEERVKYKCSNCPATYFTKSSFKTHEMTHTQQKSFECEYCNSSFTKKEKLKQHLLNHGVEQPILRCRYCSKGFSQKYRMAQHEIRCSAKRQVEEQEMD